MMPLLVFRERLKNFYQRNDIYIKPVIKFLFALCTFITINTHIGYDGRLKLIPVVLSLSLLCAFTPSAVLLLLASVVATLHIYSASPMLSIIVIMILLILYLLFIRYTPKMGYAILAIPVLYVLKIPYIIPILLGLTASPIAIIPTGCGVVIFFMFQIVKDAITMQTNTTVEDILQLYTTVIDNFKDNKLMFMSILIFTLIILVTYYVRKMKFDYAFEIAIVAGTLVSILGFLASDLIIDKSEQILSMLLGTIVSGAIVYIIHFFKLYLDYSGVELTQFEDDVYYYYVKAIPKITVTAPQVNVKRINEKNIEQNLLKTGVLKHDTEKDTDDYDEDDDLFIENNDDFDYDCGIKTDSNKGNDE